ncbi:MAG: cytochrome c-type biogenesis protein CcmH [Proteobacteria bacterium]|nr:cytochrome c-type biogenesis protein CcmH [Pseudomonadota bacterium]
MTKNSIIFILSVGLFLFSQTANSDEWDDEVRRLAHQLRCPTCQAMSVKESEAGLSLNMKLKIRKMLEEGKSNEEILQYFEERYGEWILRSPKKRGFNLLLWTLPGIVIVVAVLLLFVAMKRRSYLPKTDKLEPLSEQERTQIENDLKRL